MTTRWPTYSDRMQVTVPVGEVDGLKVERFEVKDLDDWLETDEGRTDIMSPLEYVRMIRDGRGCDPGWYTRLSDSNNKDDHGRSLIWMSDTTAERRDHKEAVARIQLGKARRILVNGLGLGMVVQAALSYSHVEHVDVVESDARVIELVGPHYLDDPRVTIHHADAFEQTANWTAGQSSWDVAWSDIWSTIGSDNLPGMDRLHAYYRRRSGWHGMWCRPECLAMRRELRAYGIEA